MIPKLYTAEEVSEILGLSTDTLARYRANGTGIQWLKVGDGGNIRYTEDAIRDYLRSCEQNQDPTAPASPQAMRAAALHGLKEVSETFKKRNAELAAADKPVDDEGDKYAVTVTRVGETIGSQIQNINLCKPQPVTEPASPHLIAGR